MSKSNDEGVCQQSKNNTVRARRNGQEFYAEKCRLFTIHTLEHDATNRFRSAKPAYRTKIVQITLLQLNTDGSV